MPKTVLILDDSELVASMLEMICTQMGWSTHVALDLGTALQWLETGGMPDAILCDLTLPDAPAGPIAPLRQAASQQTPIYLISGRPQEELDQLVGAHGVAGAVSKDAGLPGMMAALEELLG